MESWSLAFNWGQGVDFQIRDVRVRVLSDMAWVTLKAFVDMDSGPFHVTNVFEFHNGQWYMVHHHSSVMLIDAEGEHHNMIGNFTLKSRWSFKVDVSVTVVAAAVVCSILPAFCCFVPSVLFGKPKL
ncbi:hypothetical protein ACLOJK_010270 [Asimina triloba]